MDLKSKYACIVFRWNWPEGEKKQPLSFSRWQCTAYLLVWWAGLACLLNQDQLSVITGNTTNKREIDEQVLSPFVSLLSTFLYSTAKSRYLLKAKHTFMVLPHCGINKGLFLLACIKSIKVQCIHPLVVVDTLEFQLHAQAYAKGFSVCDNFMKSLNASSFSLVLFTFCSPVKNKTSLSLKGFYSPAALPGSLSFNRPCAEQAHASVRVFSHGDETSPVFLSSPSLYLSSGEANPR